MRNVDALESTSAAMNDRPLADRCGKTLSHGQDLSKQFCPGSLSAGHHEQESQHEAMKFLSCPHHSVGHADMCENVSYRSRSVFQLCGTQLIAISPATLLHPDARLCTPPQVVVY